MAIFQKTIFTGFSPNLTGRDTRVALSYLLFPWKWKDITNGKNINFSEKAIEKYFGVEHCHVFDSGRSALYFALKSLDVQKGDEVLVQAYTCMVVINAIIHTGARPVFIDIKDDFNMDPLDLEKKITPKSKVLIIQHTFGLAADMDKLIAIARKNNIRVIEDCAHAFGAKYDEKFVGTFGEVGMFSFGADKVLSCARGGALITNNQELSDKIKKFQAELPTPKVGKTIQHLMHYPFFYVGKKLYHVYLGKIILGTAKKFNLINKIIYDQEKNGQQVGFYPSRLANSLAEILLNQLEKVDEVNLHRKNISEFYEQNINNAKVELPWRNKINTSECVYLRYPILVENPERLFAWAKKQGIILGNWYDNVIAPKDIDMNKTGYELGSCPNAERLAARSINLPTDINVTIENAERVVEVINGF